MTVKTLTVKSKSETRSGYFCKEQSKANGYLIGRKKGTFNGVPYDKVIINKLLQTKDDKEWKFLLRKTPYARSYMVLTLSADVIPELIECLKAVYADYYGVTPIEVAKEVTKQDTEKEGLLGNSDTLAQKEDTLDDKTKQLLGM